MTLEDQGKLQQRIFAQRLPLFTALVTLVFSLLVLRLYYLQIVRGQHFSRLAEENRISLIRVRAPRGIVFDRHGNVLVTNRPSFSVSLDLDAVRDLDATVGAVAAALGLDRAELARKVRAVEPYRRFEPVRVKDDVSRQEVAALEALRYEHPGVLVEVEPRRSYPHGTLAVARARVRGPDQRRRAQGARRPRVPDGRLHRQDGHREGARRGAQGAGRLPADGGRLARPRHQGALEHSADPRALGDADDRPGPAAGRRGGPRGDRRRRRRDRPARRQRARRGEQPRASTRTASATA